MFAISAINDTDTKSQWEPLAPTKEAQEFHLTQTYHDGLLKLQAKEYKEARELLEAVVKDPLVSTTQVESTASDGHLLQLKYLALKNLATVFLQQGPAHYESALHCYLQAVEIDTKDSVVWNQLGTLACSMGLLSISRWAFEQGLVCSPNNWNCMEKLLEVLIAIGDEVASLSVAELILRHWPSHARALQVKRTIEESDPVPFAPRGIDKLQPEHARLKFVDKRKASDSDLDAESAPKRLNQTIKVQLKELSWTSLAELILGILLSRNGCNFETAVEKSNLSGNKRVAICLPSKLEDVEKSFVGSALNISNGECSAREENNTNSKEVLYTEAQIYERRSTRLVSLRSQKTGKEDTDLSGNKDMETVVLHSLQPYIISGLQIKDFDYSSGHSLDNEWQDVQNFVMQTSKNYGAYHLGHLLLEEVAKSGLVYQDAFMKFLELEKLTRLWGYDRTPECCLFLAELYHDLGSCSSDSSKMAEFMHEASFHLSKIIESVALEWPMDTSINWDRSCSKVSETAEEGSKSSADCTRRLKSSLDACILTEKSSFWVRFYWLSGLVSIWEGNRSRAHEEFSVSFSLLENNRNLNDIPGSVQLPHCKVNKELTTNKILHEINLLEVQYLLKNDVAEMLEKHMYLECIDMLAPLLLSAKGVNVDIALVADKDEGVTTGELSALNVLINACEKVNPLNLEVYLNCQKRKLQILMVAAGMEDIVASCDVFCEKSAPKVISAFETEMKSNPGKNYFDSIAEQVKAVSECASRVKNFIDLQKDQNDITVPRSSIADIQTLLLALMCNIARMCFCKKPSVISSPDHREQKQKCFFVNAAIAFCKLQHLDLTIPIKTQVDLIEAIHDVLAEYGLCCVGKDGEGVDGTFLKLAIKHLLAIKLKSSHQFMSKESNDVRVSADALRTGMGPATSASTESGELIAPDSNSSVESEKKGSIENIATEELRNGDETQKHVSPSEAKGEGKDKKKSDAELADDEREELESAIDNALNQCFFCLYGLNLRSDSGFEDDLAVHRNTSQADYQSKEQCADVFKYILPYAKASTKTGLIKLRRVLRAIRKHFPQPPDDVLAGNPIDKYLDEPKLCEDRLSEEAGSDGFLESIVKAIFLDTGILNQKNITAASCEPYMDVYSDLYYLLAQSEETSATDKWPGFVLTKEGEDYVEQSTNLSKYDLFFNPLRFESWQRLANIYDEEVDLLLNDGSKNINVTGWRKNASLPQRVEASRRRSRRCLLMSLALAKTSEQQSEIHEMLALVYYDGLQNVVPFFDQRSVAPIKDETWKMFCKNSKKHFEKAFAHRQDWSHAFYLGKLCQKLGCPPESSFSYYDKAIVINPSAVDALYRMHASRLKLLYRCQRKDVKALKVFAAYSFNQTTKEKVMGILNRLERPQIPEVDGKDDILSDHCGPNLEQCQELNEAWRLLYNDCLSALETCLEGDLKHFHKARYMLAQGLYKRGESGDLQKAKDEISFCFKSSRSSFTINMWEIDSSAKKGRRKAPAVSGSKKALEVNLPESSRKFITCIRKYLLFYLKLLEETGDLSTLERAYVSIRADKRFSLCLEDLVPVALGRFLKSLISSMSSADGAASISTRSSPEYVLEKMFTLFMEQPSLWPDICSSEIKCSELSESTLYGYLHQYLYSLEKSVKLEVLEGINEKIRKRCRNPKLSNSSCSGVFKHASVAWCRSLVINLVMITPICSSASGERNADLENEQLLCVDMQTNDFWSPPFGNSVHLASIETKWNTLLSKVKHVIVRKTSEENLETANSLLRATYSFYRDSSSIVLLSGMNLFWVPARLITTLQFHPSAEGVEIIDVSVPRKLLLWAYTLLHGCCPGISAVIKYCEENVKTKTKKASAALSSTSTIMPTVPAAQSAVPGGCKDGLANHGGSSEAAGMAPLAVTPSTVLPEGTKNSETKSVPSTNDNQKILSTSQQLHHCNNSNNTTIPERLTFDLNDDAEPERN